LFLDTSNVRAWPGGAGAFKVGGNYAPTVQPQMAALHKHNCSQVGRVTGCPGAHASDKFLATSAAGVWSILCWLHSSMLAAAAWLLGLSHAFGLDGA